MTDQSLLPVGHKQYHLTVLKVTPTSRSIHYLCACECGGQATFTTWQMKSRIVKCCVTERCKFKREEHGSSKTPEFLAWSHLVQRCTNPKEPCFPNYGGRGISVCDSWHWSFKAFLKDMGNRPSPKHTLDRINNEGNYEPGNCRWVTMKVNQRNKRTNRIITFNKISLPVTEWAEKMGMTKGRLMNRLNRGWSVENALTLKPQQGVKPL